MRKINALLRFYFQIDPDSLDDEEFAKRWNELEFALEIDTKRMHPNANK